MTSMHDREQALENKYAHDQMIAFNVTARRDKLLAKSVAARLGAGPGREAELVAQVVHLADGPGHDTLVIDWAASALTSGGKAVGRPELEADLKQLEAKSRKEITGS